MISKLCLMISTTFSIVLRYTPSWLSNNQSRSTKWSSIVLCCCWRFLGLLRARLRKVLEDVRISGLLSLYVQLNLFIGAFLKTLIRDNSKLEDALRKLDKLSVREGHAVNLAILSTTSSLLKVIHDSVQCTYPFIPFSSR